MLVNGAALGRHLRPQRHQRLLQTGGAVDDQEFGRLQSAGDDGRRAAPARRHRSRRPCSSRRAAPSGRRAARRGRREARSTQPSCRAGRARRCRRGSSRTMSSASSGRFDQASQSVFTFRHTRLTVSLPTAPLEQRRERPRTRRVLVPARSVPAISASTCRVMRAYRGSTLLFQSRPRASRSAPPIRPRHGDLDRPEKARRAGARGDRAGNPSASAAPASPSMASTRPLLPKRDLVSDWSPFVAPATQRDGQFLLDHPLDEAPESDLAFLVLSIGSDQASPRNSVASLSMVMLSVVMA